VSTVAPAAAALARAEDALFERRYDDAVALLRDLESEHELSETEWLRHGHLLGAALATPARRERLDRAKRLLDHRLRATEGKPTQQIPYWLQLGQVLAALGEPEAMRCFEMTMDVQRVFPKPDEIRALVEAMKTGAPRPAVKVPVQPPLVAPLAVGRAGLEVARLAASKLTRPPQPDRDKIVLRARSSGRDTIAEVVGAAHAFVDGAQVLGYVLRVPGAEYDLGKVLERVKAQLDADALSDAVHRAALDSLDLLRARDLTNAEEVMRDAHDASARGPDQTHARSLVHGLAMTLHAAGRYVEADIVVARTSRS
jgi:hypothetical protein